MRRELFLSLEHHHDACPCGHRTTELRLPDAAKPIIKCLLTKYQLVFNHEESSPSTRKKIYIFRRSTSITCRGLYRMEFPCPLFIRGFRRKDPTWKALQPKIGILHVQWGEGEPYHHASRSPTRVTQLSITPDV